MLSRMLTIREQLLLGGFGAALVLGASALVWYHSWGPGAKASGEWINQVPEESLALDTGLASGVGASETEIILPEARADASYILPPLPGISVTVRGAVVHEGVFDFGPNARVHEALEAAGGALKSADLSDLNLSARLVDATTLIVPYNPYGPGPTRESRFGPLPHASLNPAVYTLSGQGVAAAGGSGGGAPGSSGPLINLNTAGSAELETLPGIGPSFAQRIIAYREQGPFQSIQELMEVSGIGEKRFEAVRDMVTVE